VLLEVNRERRGVLQVSSIEPDCFDQADLRFLQAVGHWVGLVTHRAELATAMAAQAFAQGQYLAAEELARLTERQREVACFIAAGLSNEEIAEQLGITPGTVGNHIEQILRRLRLHNRTQVATWAVQRGLYRQPVDGATAGPDPS
jgi:DNA-binding NarL/FixJ family response regulator